MSFEELETGIGLGESERAVDTPVPTQSQAGEPAMAPAHDWPHGTVAFGLPEECVTTRVGDRFLFSPPENLNASEVSEWNQLQFSIQERIETWSPQETIAPSYDAEVDVGAQSTTRDQLRELLASASCYASELREARYRIELATWEERLRSLLWQSQWRTLNRRVTNAEVGQRRASIARERLRREAPAELHERVEALRAAKRLAEREINDKGQDAGDKIGWLSETIGRIRRMPTMTAVERYDLEQYERELTERSAKLAAAETELADVERRMLES